MTDTQRIDWLEADELNWLAVHFQMTTAEATVREMIDYLMGFKVPLDAPHYERTASGESSPENELKALKILTAVHGKGLSIESL